MWWPPLLVWLVVCLSQWAATTAGVLPRISRVLWATFCVSGVGFLSIARIQGMFQYGDPTSQTLWKAVVCAGVPLFMALSPLVFMKLEGGYRFDWRVRAVISGLAGCAGLASAWYW